MLMMTTLFRQTEITFEAALRDLGERRWEARARAAAALSTCDPADRDEAAAALRGALGDGRGEVRYAAARSLGELGDRGAVPALLRLLGDSDGQVREAAALALGQIGDEAAIGPLGEALRGGPPEVRFQAAAALAALDLGGARSGPLLRQALGDEDPEVRGSAAAALGELPPDPETAAALAARLGDSHAGPRAEAALALARLGDGRAVPVLCELLEDRSRGLEAAAALALVPDERAAEPLRGVLRRFLPSPLLKARCAFALGKLHPSEGLTHLERLGRSLRPDVRGLAEELLAALRAERP